MNRRELLDKHPDWYAVNRKGESCHDKPAYVDYYRFLCPNHQGVAEYLAEDYVKLKPISLMWMVFIWIMSVCRM